MNSTIVPFYKIKNIYCFIKQKFYDVLRKFYNFNKFNNCSKKYIKKSRLQRNLMYCCTLFVHFLTMQVETALNAFLRCKTM